ncbi:restriction endonuclease subunit S [Dechloromonas sp. TW-R-39-2]|uniref:restriction endonuclease subunit S n=1 Tax=Dechloromonas sp. TW-R-39-2 TaxID=2654218 RepID=UPI00193DA4DC|nr:restriction endonuclease subunit S [Dechloromonas sp. TW-R-39-2]QRM19009.1 restriction endonuclease subunit S [Dechloromonas sp. TW-R-39-2]
MSEQSLLLPPPDWKPATLGQVSECILGGTPSTEIPQFWNGDVPWMASGDVHIRRIRDVPGRITALGLRSSNATLTNPPAVAIGLAGQGKTRGTVALTLCTLSTNQSIALLKANGSDLRTDYLFHNLDRRYEELRARSSGGGRGGLSKAILEAVPIDLPPLSDQQKIAQVLDTLDIAIHETKAILAKLKAVKQGLLHDLLMRGIDVNGELRQPQAEAPHLYKQSPLGWIPKEWEDVTLGEIARRSGGFLQTGPFGSQLHAHEYVLDGIPVIMPQDMVNGELSVESIARINQRKATALSRHRVQPNDLVFSRRGDLSRCVAIEEEHLGWLCGTGCLLARLPAHDVNGYWLALVYTQPGVQTQVMGRAVGSTMANLNTSILAAITIARPPVTEQNEIARRLKSLNKRIRFEEEELEKRRFEKTGLMDDLLTGRVRVTGLHCEVPLGMSENPIVVLEKICLAAYRADKETTDEIRKELFGDVSLPTLVVMNKDSVKVEIRTENVNHHEPHMHITHSGKFDVSINLKDFSQMAGNIDSKTWKRLRAKLWPFQERLLQIWNKLNKENNGIEAKKLITELAL